MYELRSEDQSPRILSLHERRMSILHYKNLSLREYRTANGPRGKYMPGSQDPTKTLQCPLGSMTFKIKDSHRPPLAPESLRIQHRSTACRRCSVMVFLCGSPWSNILSSPQSCLGTLTLQLPGWVQNEIYIRQVWRPSWLRSLMFHRCLQPINYGRTHRHSFQGPHKGYA